jgi:NodT family efflux transporter outer membrane factor (OMF) lipoprotein
VAFQPLPGRRNDLGVMARWEIDLWGRIQRNIEASGAAAQASAADLAAMKLSLQAQLAEHYFNLRVQDNQIQLLQAIVTVQEQHLKVTQNQYAVGVADRSAVLQVQSKLNELQSQMHEAKVSRAQWEHAVAVLIGKPPADFSIAPSLAKAKVPDIPLALPADLLLRRPDIAAAERRMAAASAKIGEAEASAYPTLSLFAGVSIQSGLLGGPSISAPLFTGGQNKARQSEASSAYAEAMADYQQTVLNGFREVEDGLASLESLAAAAVNTEAAIKASRSTAQIMDNQHKVGIINSPVLIGAQTAALESEKGSLAILAKRLTASVGLIKALGGGWQASDLNANVKAEAKP